MANGITSEWEDAHVKLGNYEARPVVTPQHQINTALQEKIEEKKLDDYLQKKQEDDLDSLEDEFENDDFYQKFKEQRLNEMKVEAQKAQFGSVIEIARDEYVAQVTSPLPAAFLANYIIARGHYIRPFFVQGVSEEGKRNVWQFIFLRNRYLPSYFTRSRRLS